MKTLITKIGNSAGTIIPAPLLKSLGLALGDRIEMEVYQDTLVIKKLTKRPHYSLAELLAQCDETAPMPKEISDWDNAEPTGNEAW